MADEPWLLKEDGYLNVEPNLKQIVYHPSLNVILICTNAEIVHVLDVNSGVVLQSSRLCAQENSKVTCKYLTGQDKVLFCDGHGIGVRSDYNGVLLLDTILQKPVATPKDVIKLELLLSEAILLKQNLMLMTQFVIEQLPDVITELCEKIVEAQRQTKKGIKAQKWNTVCLELPLELLKRVAEVTVSEFTLKNQHVPELAVAAAVQERLNELLSDPVPATDKSAMGSEARRLETFSKWPHMDYKWALPDKMAQAGFYHQPNSTGDDRAMCFTCSVCLVCWERTDEPWSEHERHSPNCPFVMGEYTQNVPLSVTYATAPALDATFRGQCARLVGSSSVPHLVATATGDGLVTVYDVSGKLKSTHAFYVTQFDSPILECCLQEFGRNYGWIHRDEGRTVSITALAVVGEEKAAPRANLPDKGKRGRVTKDSSSSQDSDSKSGSSTDESATSDASSKAEHVRPAVICGITVRGLAPPLNHVASIHDVKAAAHMIIEDMPAKPGAEHASCLCLAVYDFQYKKDVEREPEPPAKKASNMKPVSNILLSMMNELNAGVSMSEGLSFINDMHYQALQLIKQTEAQNYQNLIPGESDEIYLPPTPKSQDSGTRVLIVDDAEEPDASASVNYQYMNGQLNSPPEAANNFADKGISDHITDLKSSKIKKLNYSHAVQCVPLPAHYKNQPDLEIFEVLPTRDAAHILVVLRCASAKRPNVLLVYQLCFTAAVVNLVERPVLVRELPASQCPVEVTVIPSVEKAGGPSESAGRPGLDGSVVLVCADGAVRIFDLGTLLPGCVAKLDADKFVSAVYCNSLERLCAATASGSLHFYALNEAESELGEDHDDEQLLSTAASCSTTDIPSATAAAARPEYAEGGAPTLHVNDGELSMQDLRYLHALCAFEPLSAAYCVVVPPCWSEMQQAQRQRRHPQYLTGDEQHTRTWRLQTDTTTWDEHIFELTLPEPVNIGHMDVHFSLHGQHSNPPHVEVTLLRQHTTGIGHRRTEVHFQVDETISFECLQRNQNPVTSREYLRSHNADILAGPLNLADCLDLTEQNGCVTLTSPKLFKANTRTLLLHIKALCDPSKEHHSIRKEFKRKCEQSSASANGGGGVGGGVGGGGSSGGGGSGSGGSANASSSGTLSNKAEYYMGCDCLHELSITIYKARHVDVPSEKLQRSAMLESNQLLATLLRAPLDAASAQKQSLAFHVLTWIASIRLARNRAASSEPPPQQLECLRTVEPELEPLLKQCVLRAGRSIARKCVKFIIVCSDGARNVSEAVGQQFDNKVFGALLQCLPEIGRVWSAGALHWLMVVLLRVTRDSNHQALAAQCVLLLRQLAHEMHTRTNPYHLLLRSRFGLFGTPLEPELFDIEPPAPAKSSSIPLTYASVMTADLAGHNPLHASLGLSDVALDNKDLLIVQPSDWKLRLKTMAPNKHMRGLLETEPLHFACVAASDGTRVERFDPSVPPVNMCGFYGSVPPVSAQHPQHNSGTKKADSDDIKDKENVTLAELDITLEPSNSSIEMYPKELAQLLLNADIQKADPHCWTIMGNKIDGLEMAIEEADAVASSELLINSNGVCGPGCSKPPTWTRPDHMELLSPQCSLQQLLVAPPQQVMVVERMQSGARRFVTLDFGAPVLLTDVIIPACHDLVSLSLDLWLRGEDADAVRLVLATDIGTKTLVLSDLQPPPICRYLKITTIGRYGMSTTRCKIPIGNFYGHMLVLPDEVPPDGDPLSCPCLNAADIDNQMNMLTMLLEDVNCRYSLACSRLKELLHPLLTSDIPNTVHMTAYMNIVRDTVEQSALSADNAKVFGAYQEAMMYQRQLNVVQGVIRRIEGSAGLPAGHAGLADACSDKLRVLAESLLDVLLSLSSEAPLERAACQQLCQGLCVAQGPRLQMLAATLLVRTCGRQPFWGDLLADTLAHMFSSTYTTLFPLDRMFVLLTYLGRKSPERGLVLDATLRVLAEVLHSLGGPQGSLLAVRTDLSLLGWILLYLSMQLDSTSKAEGQCGSRWTWLTGDNNIRTSDTGVCPSSQRRKLQRRYMHYKQQFDQLDWTKKAVQASTQVQALSALSSQAATLSTKLEAALKQQETVFKRIKQYNSKQKDITVVKFDGGGSSVGAASSKGMRVLATRAEASGAGSAPPPPDSTDTAAATSTSAAAAAAAGQPVHALDADHCLAVARGLVSLLLTMDHSCSADMFLLACKVVGRLVTMARLSMWQLFNVEQLQQLMRYCVRSDQPWMQHALSCLLQDLLDVSCSGSAAAAGPGGASASAAAAPVACSSAASMDETFEPAATEMDTDTQPPGPSWKPPTATEIFETYAIEENVMPQKLVNAGKSNSNPLPSVYESDDSELDDFLDDILERGRSLLRRNGSCKAAAATVGSISSAMDARLELGVDAAVETRLRRLTSLASGTLLQQLAAPTPAAATSAVNNNNNKATATSSSGTSAPSPRLEPPPWPDSLLHAWGTGAAAGSGAPPQHRTSNYDMLATCFNVLFGEMQLYSAADLEQTVRLWLTLNRTSVKNSFNPGATPVVPLSAHAVSSLVAALAYTPNLTLRTWCVALQALTLCCNLPATHSDWLEHSLNGMAATIVAHQEFVPMLLRLLAANGALHADKGLAGPSVCRALHDLLVRLMMRCDVTTAGSSAGVRLKELLLRLLYQLVQPNGPLALHQGPLDVQCKFLQALLNMDFADTNLGIVMCILESTGVLVNSYVSNVERIKCVNLGERNGSSPSNFSGLFASVLGSDSSKQDRPASWESLLVALLKLLTRLVQTPLPADRNVPSQQDTMDTETDESKAERQQEGSREPSTRVPCLADTVLLHHVSIMRLCHSLAACSGSSLAMLVGCAQQIGLTDLGEPTTVGDAVFQLLSVMTQKTSKPELILEPLVLFLKAAPQLSEPLLWFMLQVLNTDDALTGFLNLNGVLVLAESMVRSSLSLSAVHHGTISLIMHHMASAPAPATGATRSDATLSYAAPSFNKKVQQANMENAEALVNFAPLGSIRCHSGTAQPADVLIQSAVASHRRARTPQWCYHFYPDETHTDLTIKLPCAVLLREVQLQPHLSSLSTCPSAVALEVSNGNPDHLVPASPPLPTSGMTFIRLHLPVAEVVTHVLLRLYKPRDASNIGLSQIRLLGTSAFGGLAKATNLSDVSDEETFSKFSLGWLRLLHHCFTLAPADSELERRVVASASQVPNLLVTCCGLLLVPTHIPTLYLPNLERVLCKLSLHNRESGLSAIRMLLGSKAALSGSTHALLSSKTQLALSSPATQSVCELLHQVCEHQDEGTQYRVSEVLRWLEQAAAQAVAGAEGSDNSSPAFVSCIASILWSASEAGVPYPLHAVVSTELFGTIFRWAEAARDNVVLKNALDRLLCSLCYIKTELFPVLLQRMGVLVPNLSTDLTASISDDRKDSECMTDDNKQSFEDESEWYGRLIIGELSRLSLSEAQLATIAMVSRSPPVIQQLLDSGLPKLLIRAVLEFCAGGRGAKVPMARIENVTAILKFFADVCAEQMMRDWLGSADGSVFWLPLLQWMCHKPTTLSNSRLRTEAHARLEEECVRFLSKCCLCHRANQRLLAKVLCDVISQQHSGISGFMRRLVLQLLLENEKVLVCIKADESIYKVSPIPQPAAPLHPVYKRTHDRVLLQLSTNTTIGEILEQHVAFATSLKTDAKPKEYFCASPGPNVHKEVWEFTIDGSDHISMAAGVTAKDKRAKDVKNQVLSATPQLKKKRYTASEGMNGLVDPIGGRTVRCETLPEHALPPGLTLAQLLALVEGRQGQPDIHLTITHAKDDKAGRREADSLLQQRPIGNALQVFSTMGGLALLAQHLPTVYPEIVRPSSAEKPSATEQADTDWVKVEGSDDIYDDLEEMPGSSTPSKNCSVVTNVPPHSLTAFGLFLRLPGYAEVLLKDSKKALCLLRLVLGVTDDGEGGDIFLSSVADSLPTLPFEVLRQLYDSTPLGTDDGRLLRTISINIGVTQLLLTCLAVFTHQIQPHVVSNTTPVATTSNTDTAKEANTATRTDDKGQLYWAKGTGFGTGSTQQSWNVEQALLRQRSEEEHVTVLLQVLASYINPGGNAADELADASVLPAAFEQQLANSCLLPALSSYLRNDSVLDMARHIPLYGSVLQLLRAMALSQQLISLLLPRPNGDATRPPSIVSLLQKMKSCVDNYTCRLRFNKSSSKQFKFAKYTAEQTEESETDEGLALLMPDIQETANLVQQATNQILGADDAESALREPHPIERPLQQSLEQRYLDIMRRLQFDTFEMITESPDGYKFVVSYHFEGNVRSAGEQSQPARVKRLAQEAVTLATSLPLSYSSSVFVRCDTDRLDIMKVLITGPADTPYANGCFELDVYFPPDYPNVPMLINLETTGHHTVRFNPNLYNDGKVCLSVLNTWHGRPEEKWNAQTSSFLQVLVSIQSLILVPEPYFNEPGYERSRGTPSGTQSSREYNTNICQATVRWAMLEQIMNPCPCFKSVIHTHFWLKRHEILAQVEGWIADMEAQLAEKRSGRSANKRTTLTNLDTFKKNYHQLREQLAKLSPPDGLEELPDVAMAVATGSAQPQPQSQPQPQPQPQAPHDIDIDTDIDMEKLVSEVVE